MSSSSTLNTIEKLLDHTRIYAMQVITDFPEAIIYHDIEYAHRLIKNIEKISKTENLSEEDTNIAKIIAWSFTTGFDRLESNFDNGIFENNLTDNAQRNAKKILKEVGLEKSETAQIVLTALERINMPRIPITPIEKVVCDSITADLVCEGDASILKKIYQEILLHDVNLSKSNWYDVIINMSSLSALYTEYGKKEIAPKLDEVIESVKQEQKSIENATKKIITKELEISDKELKKLKKRVNNMKGRDDRAIQTLMRTTSKNHYTLNEMVDRKANIMITVNSIILSLVISGVIGRSQLEHPIHYLPVAMLALTSIGSIVFAILSILPNRTQGTFSEEEIRGKQGNLLYFGNFHEMKQRDYEWGMLQMMNDSEYLYSSMVRDIYYLGQILYSKYSLIRWSLRIFLGGFVISLISFGIIRSFVHIH